MIHFMTQYLGRPWVMDARGPDAFDCWGLVYWVYKTHLNVQLPAYVTELATPIPTHPATITGKEQGKPAWSAVARPLEGCVVALSGNKAVHHVGIYFGGLVYHAACAARVHALKFHRLPASGFNTVICYKYNGSNN